ncbi:hypothetical protein QTP86_028544 [Hemibagrus guttatus]|nr:hypothetical protein QTP86_028544 [Hemibagrus guttatus]
MADPGMMSLFGDDGNLFSDGLEGLGDCSYSSQGQTNSINPQMTHEHQAYSQISSSLHLSSPPVPSQPKMGHPFDHFGQYDPQGGRMMANGPGPGPGPANGISSPHSRYHGGNGTAGGHHVYPGAQGDGRGGGGPGAAQSFQDAGGATPGNNWGPQGIQLPDQNRAQFPQSQQQQVHGHQMGPYMGRTEFGGMQGHNQTQTPPRMNHFPQGLPQEANRFMGHIGSNMTTSAMRHPSQTPQHQQAGQQFLHHHPESQFPQSPSKQQQMMSGRGHQNMGFSMNNQQVANSSSGQYAPYPQYGGLNQGLANASGMSLNTSSNPNAPVQCYPTPAGPQCYPVNQLPPQNMHSAQPKIPQQQPQQQHLAPPPQGSYATPPSMSPMRNLGGNPAGTPPPQRGQGPVSHPQQHPQMYGTLSPNQRAMNAPNHTEVLPQQMQTSTLQFQQVRTPPALSVPQQPPGSSPPPPLPQGNWSSSTHSSPPANHHQVPHMQHSPSDTSQNPSSTHMSTLSSTLQPGGCETQPPDREPKPKKKKKKKAKASTEAVGEKDEDVGMDVGGVLGGDGATSPPEKKSKKKPKEKEAKEPKEAKPPKTPKTPKTPKEPKEKKVKMTTPKPKSTKKPSSKKADTESSTKKEGKRKRDSSITSDTEKTPPPSPEEEDDDGVQKRRSSRQVKRKRYTEDLEFRISDDDDDEDSAGPKSPSTTSEQTEVPDAEGPVVEKIMGLRKVKKQLESGQEVEIEEFYVKFKSFSYLHCRWADLEELEKDKRIHQKVKRFKAKQAHNNFLTEMDDEPFNPDYVEVDRVLDVSENTDENGEPVSLYLVKWCSLPYEDSTWELKADIDAGKIEEFERVMSREPQLKRVERPPASDWQKSESSREYKNDNALREYQLEGVNWLLFNWYNTRNCILADEMGLGKTVQSITFLYEIYLKGIHGPFLVIAPLSTIPNWEREFRTWTELNVVVYHGSQASRRTIQAYEMNYRDSQGRVIKGAYKFHAIITTFEMILTDCPELRSVPWRCVIIDEAHRLKNRNCKLLEGLKLMDMEHKVLLTGTPLQNTVEELFSLLNFLEPERFPSESTFMQEFGDLKTEEQVQKLQGILKPMMLRRLKEDVEKNLAPKEETIIEVELTNIQKKYYRAILEKNFTFLSKGGGGGGSNVPNLLNTMMELRKCCNHPYLINGAEEKIMEEFRESHPADMPDFHLQSMIQAAGKLVLIDKLLPKLKSGGHRVLIFSQMVRCLDILEDYLIQRRYPYERIDGRVRGNLRQAAIDRFSRPDSDRFVFLLCTRAGGLGINLTAADTCIIFDSDWNPQNDLQAQARCHRIGQSKAVKIYRLITRNSYEREMFDKASLKLGLDKAVLQSMSGRENAANGVQQLSKKEIEDLLRKGAYGALMDEEDEGSKFCEEDIDQILQRRTQTITIESEGKGSTFAKASFVSSGNRTDISLEDPDFWQKWAKKAELDLDAINGRNTLVIDTPRVRKQTRHYSSIKEDEMMEYSELESDSEDKPVQKARRPQDRAQGYPRSECFRVEKNLLVYGWGRWKDILSHGRFKRPLYERDIEMICRALLAYCLLHYRGDENIKSFIWDLITPTEDGQSKTLTNHSGLSAPVPRGRKGKKGKLPATQTNMPQADWLSECNPDVLLQEDSYKRHLKHHCNNLTLSPHFVLLCRAVVQELFQMDKPEVHRALAICSALHSDFPLSFRDILFTPHYIPKNRKVLLRVRMLYYLRQEVIGDLADRILEGADSSELDIWIPHPLHAEVPTDWWDVEADKSLLIGVFKHGYEKYNSMRADPALCFLERVGMPDAKAIAAEQRGADMVADGEDEDPEYKPLRMPFKDDLDDFTNSPLDDKEDVMDVESAEAPRVSEVNGGKAGNLYWPAASALTARLRRLITAYQRCHKRQETLIKPDGRRRRRHRDDHLLAMATEGGVYSLEPNRVAATSYLTEGASFVKTSPFLHESAALLADGAAFFKERRQRWTRREEADFYRVVSTFGVVYDVQTQRFDWSQFRAFARLDKKTDESLEKYYYAFVAMCKRVCRMQVKDSAELADPTLIIDPITEERASRTLYRIELLRQIREQVLPHPKLEERLRLCQPSPDLPAWWEAGKHDRDLLQGAAKHGVSRTDYHIQNDPELGFLQAQRKFVQSRGSETALTSNPLAAVDLIKDEELKDELKCDTVEKADIEEVKEEKVEAASPVQDVKTEEEEKMENENELKSEENQSVPQLTKEETVTKSEDMPILSTTDGKDTNIEEQENPTGSENHNPNTEEEEEEEEKMDEDDKSEKSSQAEAGASSDRKNFDEESNASMSTARDDTRDYFGMDDVEPSVSQTFGERATFSFWPKDRVMINRLDSICEAIIKGKWPSNRRQFFDLPGLLPGYSAMATDSPIPRRNMGDFSMMNQSSYSGSDDITLSPQEEALSLSVPRQRRRRRRKVEIEAERAAKRRNLMEMVAQLRESHATESQTQAMDLTKALHGLAPSTSSSSSAFPSAVASPMELLHAAGASRANGVMLEAEIPTRRRRGRRKNVEGLELLFMGNKGSKLNTEDSNGTKGFADGAHVLPQAQTHIPAPAQKEEGDHLKGEDGASTKDLQEWLRQHPTYTMDVPGYIPKSEELLLSQLGKPKQKRHRCRNPNKIDINTLTGEERVPVMGGAMAPPMKDLPRWLAENPEFAIAPDWTDIVKQSGFLPESMFDRLLTGPVVREEGIRRRGRRPKSEIAKAAAAQASLSAASSASTSGVNPFLLNGLFGGMDLSSLQNLQNLQNLQLLMGLSPSLGAGAADNKTSTTMLPLMLPAMGALPNVFSLGGLFGGNMAAAAAAAASNLNTNATAMSESEKTKKDGEPKEEGDEKKEEAEKPTEAELSDASAAAAATGLSTSTLAFNPFLLSTMAPGLFYPSMFLPPGLGGLGLPGFSPAALAELQNAMSGALGATGEEKEANKETAQTPEAVKPSSTLENSDSEEGENKTDDLTGVAEELDSMEAGEEEEEEEEEDEEVVDDDEDKSD